MLPCTVVEGHMSQTCESRGGRRAALVRCSARRPRERTAADEVEVEVEDALACALPIVGHEAEVVEPLLLGDGGGGDHQVSERGGVLGRGGTEAGEAVPPFGDDQHVRARHWVDVAESVAHLGSERE
jgi:hypothetical protein